MPDSINIVVDVEALQELANRLARIDESLKSYKDDLRAYGPATGSAKVQSQLNSFVNGWSDGRKKIEGNVEKLKGKVVGVAQTYFEQEQALAQQAQAHGK